MARRAQEFVVRRHGPDYLLLSVLTVIIVIGLIAVYSSSYALGYAQFDDANYFIKKQILFAVLGCIGMFIMMNIDYRILMRLSPLLMLGALIGLAAVLLPGIGVEQNGARRWIALGPLPPLQPSEFAKVAVLIYMAAWLAAKGETVRDFSLGVLPFVSMVGLVGALIMLEPDMGTAMMVALITGTLFFVAGARLTHLLALVGSGLVMAVVLIFSHGYRADRLMAFTSGDQDPTGLGFHGLQMLVAFGSGGIDGLGLGVSRQKFFYVPGSHTDGILSIIGEELGFIGVTVVLLLFAVLLARGLRIAMRAADKFGSLLATGVLAWIALQLLINVGGVTHSIPLTGIPLPFLSYGGSSLMALLIAVGVLLSVSRYAATEDTEQYEPTRGVLRVDASAREGGAMRFALAGGGTGGHAYPSITVGEELRAQGEADLVYYGTERGPEHTLAEDASIRFRGIPASQVRGGPKRMLTGGLNLLRGKRRRRRVLPRGPARRRSSPPGGYAAAPVGWAAHQQRVPMLLFLPDVYPGWAVRFLDRYATTVACSVAAATKSLPAHKTVVTGYPVRPQFHEATREAGIERFGLDPDWPTLLVTGGSLGARSINQAIARALERILDARPGAPHLRPRRGVMAARRARAPRRRAARRATTCSPTPRRWRGRWRPRTSR